MTLTIDNLNSLELLFGVFNSISLMFLVICLLFSIWSKVADQRNARRRRRGSSRSRRSGANNNNHLAAPTGPSTLNSSNLHSTAMSNDNRTAALISQTGALDPDLNGQQPVIINPALSSYEEGNNTANSSSNGSSGRRERERDRKKDNNSNNEGSSSAFDPENPPPLYKVLTSILDISLVISLCCVQGSIMVAYFWIRIMKFNDYFLSGIAFTGGDVDVAEVGPKTLLYFGSSWLAVIVFFQAFVRWSYSPIVTSFESKEFRYLKVLFSSGSNGSSTNLWGSKEKRILQCYGVFVLMLCVVQIMVLATTLNQPARVVLLSVLITTVCASISLFLLIVLMVDTITIYFGASKYLKDHNDQIDDSTSSSKPKSAQTLLDTSKTLLSRPMSLCLLVILCLLIQGLYTLLQNPSITNSNNNNSNGSNSSNSNLVTSRFSPDAGLFLLSLLGVSFSVGYMSRKEFAESIMFCIFGAPSGSSRGSGSRKSSSPGGHHRSGGRRSGGGGGGGRREEGTGLGGAGGAGGTRHNAGDTLVDRFIL